MCTSAYRFFMIFFLALSSSVTLALFGRAIKIRNENTIRAASLPDKANAVLAEGGSCRRRLHLFNRSVSVRD